MTWTLSKFEYHDIFECHQSILQHSHGSSDDTSMPKTPAMKNPTPSRLYQAIGVVEIEAVLWICYLQVHSLGICFGKEGTWGAEVFSFFFCLKKTKDLLIARPGAKTMWFFIFFWGFYTPWSLTAQAPEKLTESHKGKDGVFQSSIFQVAMLLNFESVNLWKCPEKFG